MKFLKIQPEQKERYDKYLKMCPEAFSDVSFTNLYGWGDIYGLTWAFTEELVFILQESPETKFWAPVGNWASVDWADALKSVSTFPLRFDRVPESLVRLWEEKWGNGMQIKDARGEWDYLYTATDLIELKGNKYHSKKNLVHQFQKSVSWEYLPFENTLVEKALQMQENWCAWRDCESSEALAAENRVIEKLLHHWDSLPGLLGGALLTEGEMIAYTIAEKISTDTILIHVEKGNPDYKGAYQAINRIFLENELKKPENREIRFVNREQDLDNEGLRKAKLSYHPTHFVQKYKVTFPEPFS